METICQPLQFRAALMESKWQFFFPKSKHSMKIIFWPTWHTATCDHSAQPAVTMQPPNPVNSNTSSSVWCPTSTFWHFQCTLGYFGVSVIHQTPTWATGSLMYVSIHVVFLHVGPWFIVSFKRLLLMMKMMKWCLMSSDVSWHIRDKLWPMPQHGSIQLYVHGNQKAR